MPPCHRARVPNLVTVFNRLIAPKVVSDRQTAAFPPCQSSAPRRCCIMDRKGGNGVLFSEGTCLPPPLFYFPLKCNHFHVVHDHLSANEHTYVLTHTQVIQTFRSSQLNVHFCVFFLSKGCTPSCAVFRDLAPLPVQDFSCGPHFWPPSLTGWTLFEGGCIRRENIFALVCGPLSTHLPGSCGYCVAPNMALHPVSVNYSRVSSY